MARLAEFLPQGILRFAAGRLLRALVSLLLFQLILFTLLQTLPSTNAASSEGQAMAAIFASRPSGGSSEAAAGPTSGEGQASGPAAGSQSASAVESLRESAQSPEMVALLDEAMGEDKRVDQSRSPAVEVLPTAAAIATAEPVSAVEVESGAVSGATATAQPSSSVESDVERASSYGAGLATLRPRDQSLLERFVDWMKAFFSGDLGEASVAFGRPVSELLGEKLPDTLVLFVPGTIGGFLLGVWLGKRIAWRQRGWVDLIATVGGTAFYTSFPPWLAFVMAGIFAAQLRWVPPDGLRNPLKWVGIHASFDRMLIGVLLTFALAVIAALVLIRLTRSMRWYRGRTRVAGLLLVAGLAAAPWVTSGYWVQGLDILHHLALPLATLILLSFGETMLIMRATMAEVKHEGFVFQARATGAPESRIRDHQVARVAVLPVLSRFVVQLPFVVIGSFFLEERFFIDGIGKELVAAANRADLPEVMATLSLVGIGLLLAHVTFDLLTAWLDPRKRKMQTEPGA